MLKITPFGLVVAKVLKGLQNSIFEPRMPQRAQGGPKCSKWHLFGYFSRGFWKAFKIGFLSPENVREGLKKLVKEKGVDGKMQLEAIL